VLSAHIEWSIVSPIRAQALILFVSQSHEICQADLSAEPQIDIFAHW
jgi:hypothetical protein